jgi:hypothetical protein
MKIFTSITVTDTDYKRLDILSQQKYSVAPHLLHLPVQPTAADRYHITAYQLIAKIHDHIQLLEEYMDERKHERENTIYFTVLHLRTVGRSPAERRMDIS